VAKHFKQGELEKLYFLDFHSRKSNITALLSHEKLSGAGRAACICEHGVLKL